MIGTSDNADPETLVALRRSANERPAPGPPLVLQIVARRGINVLRQGLPLDRDAEHPHAVPSFLEPGIRIGRDGCDSVQCGAVMTIDDRLGLEHRGTAVLDAGHQPPDHIAIHYRYDNGRIFRQGGCDKTGAERWLILDSGLRWKSPQIKDAHRQISWPGPCGCLGSWRFGLDPLTENLPFRSCSSPLSGSDTAESLHGSTVPQETISGTRPHARRPCW